MMKKLALGIGLLALCGGMMACTNEDCAKDYDDCVAACTADNKEECEKACAQAKVECEDSTCTTPLIIAEINTLKSTVNYADTGAENCLLIATNVTSYLSAHKDALSTAVTDWSAYESGDAMCKVLNGALTGLALIDLYTIYSSIETCQTSLVDSGLGDTIAKLDAAMTGLTTVEGIQAALTAGANAAAGSTGK